MTKTTPHSEQPACPTCEFKHGTHGEPERLEGGRIRCAHCHSIWREMNAPEPVSTFDANPIRGFGKRRTKPGSGAGHGPGIHDGKFSSIDHRFLSKSTTTADTDINAITVFDTDVQEQDDWIVSPFRFRLLAVPAATAFACILTVMAAFEYVVPGLERPAIDYTTVAGIGANDVAIDEITLTRHQRVDGLAVMVSGVLRNQTSREIPLKNFTVHLKNDSDKTVYRWIYRPPVAKLGPGENIRFSSAVAGAPANAHSAQVLAN